MCQDDFIHDVILADDDLTEAFANTWDPLLFEEPERLGTVVELRAFLGTHALLQEGEDLTPADLERVRETRDDLRAIYAADNPAMAVQLLNRFLDQVWLGPFIARTDSDHDAPGHAGNEHSESDGLAYRLPADTPVTERLRAIVGVTTIGTLTRWGARRFRVCEAHPCRYVFIDVSRNGRRRFCGVKCQNRTSARSYRRRTSTAGSGVAQ